MFFSRDLLTAHSENQSQIHKVYTAGKEGKGSTLALKWRRRCLGGVAQDWGLCNVTPPPHTLQPLGDDAWGMAGRRIGRQALEDTWDRRIVEMEERDRKRRGGEAKGWTRKG